MLLEGHIELSIKNLLDTQGCQLIVDSLSCKKHNLKARLRRATLEERPGVVIKVCCDELKYPLLAELRDAGFWRD
jgi:hypothetical protein